GGHFAAPVGTALVVAGVITAPPSVTVTSRIGNVVFSGGGIGYSTLQIQEGAVSIGATNGIATSAIVDVASSNSGSLDLNGFDQTLAGLARTSTTGGRDATVQNLGAPATLTLNVTGQVAYAGTIATGSTTGNAIITGELSLVKNGVGTQTLSGGGSNSYTGSTTINAGILKLQKAENFDAIPISTAVSINAVGTLQLGQSSQISDDITGFVINGGTFDLGQFKEEVTPAVTITNGTITGTLAGFLLARGGFLASGTNTISKGISVRGADVDSGLFNVVSGTTTVSGVIQTDDFSEQGISKIGAGTLILSQTNTYTGPTTVTAGTLEFDASQTLSSLTIGDGAVVRLGPSPGGAAPLNDGLVSAGLITDDPFAEAGASPQAVPEPGALTLLAAGVLGLLGRRRRRDLR
ncbi:MAG: autotransporter-associated beta strand repeat-containing protein, partial [Chthoniobacteraceae bacterium]